VVVVVAAKPTVAAVRRSASIRAAAKIILGTLLIVYPLISAIVDLLQKLLPQTPESENTSVRTPDWRQVAA